MALHHLAQSRVGVAQRIVERGSINAHDRFRLVKRDRATKILRIWLQISWGGVNEMDEVRYQVLSRDIATPLHQHGNRRFIDKGAGSSMFRAPDQLNISGTCPLFHWGDIVDQTLIAIEALQRFCQVA